MSREFRSTGSTNYSYERRGALLREQKTIGSATYSTAYRYDGDSNRASMTYPSGRTVNYTFDFADRPISAVSGSTTIVSSASYLPFGPATQFVFGNGTTKTMTYDNRYRVLENRLTGLSGTIADYTYQEDGAGNILQIHDAVDPTYNRDFGYDDLSRLVTANSGSALWGAGAYSYDAMGNMLTSALGSRTSTFTYSGTTPKLANVVENGASKTVTYDAAGNEILAGTTQSVYSPRNQLISADQLSYAYDGRGIRTITISPSQLAGITIDPVSVTGGTNANGTVTLSGPAPSGGMMVALSSNSSSASVPSSVVVAEGAVSGSFAIGTSGVVSTTLATITVASGSIARTATFTILPPAVTSVTVSPIHVTGGVSASGTITLSAAAPAGGISVTLSSSSAAASVPASVIVPSGASTATFSVTTTPVVATTSATISASANGTSSASLTIDPAVVASVSLSPSTVNAGTSASGTVMLTGAAPAGGVIVSLSSDRSEATVPSSVTVLAGTTSASFTVATSSSTLNTTTATIRATTGATSVTTALTINASPGVLTALSLTPSTIVGGNPVTGTVTLSNPAHAGGVIVALSDDTSLATVPVSVTVPRGSTSASFTIDTTTIILTASTVVITASANGVTQSATLTVNPPPNLAILSLQIHPPNVVGGSSATGRALCSLLLPILR